MACDVCGGDGKVAEKPCARCDGRGREVATARRQRRHPAGIADGQRIRVTGRGHAGERGGPPGDLYVLVHVAADERFLRDGDDLVTVLDVPAPIAALGATLEVPTLDGDDRRRGPAGTQPGEAVRPARAGHAAPAPARARRGDLRVVVERRRPAQAHATSSSACWSSWPTR